jgi:hypothetical protein
MIKSNHADAATETETDKALPDGEDEVHARLPFPQNQAGEISRLWRGYWLTSMQHEYNAVGGRGNVDIAIMRVAVNNTRGIKLTEIVYHAAKLPPGFRNDISFCSSARRCLSFKQ